MDKDNIILLFQFAPFCKEQKNNIIMEKVVWAIKDDNGDYLQSKFKRFITKHYSGTPDELKKYVSLY